VTLPQFLKIIWYISQKIKTIMKVRIGLWRRRTCILTIGQMDGRWCSSQFIYGDMQCYAAITVCVRRDVDVVLNA